MAEWCQNKECCYKRNQNQIRGSKGNKYYQSNKVSGYYKHWCSMGCREQWFQVHSDTCMNAVGFIDKQTTGVDDAWEIKHEYNYSDGNGEDNRNVFFLINRLQGVRHAITKQQAQTPEQIREDYGWQTRPDSEAKPLAIQLGLAS